MTMTETTSDFFVALNGFILFRVRDVPYCFVFISFITCSLQSYLFFSLSA